MVSLLKPKVSSPNPSNDDSPPTPPAAPGARVVLPAAAPIHAVSSEAEVSRQVRRAEERAARREAMRAREARAAARVHQPTSLSAAAAVQVTAESLALDLAEIAATHVACPFGPFARLARDLADDVDLHRLQIAAASVRAMLTALPQIERREAA